MSGRTRPRMAIIPPEERIRLGLTKHVPVKRTCLRCGKKFNSAWIGDRMCPSCELVDSDPHPRSKTD